VLLRAWLPAEPGGLPRIADALAWALLPKIQENERKPPALMMPVHEAVLDLHRRGLEIDPGARIIVQKTGQRVLDLRTPEALSLPVIDLAAMEPLLTAGIKKMGSLSAQRLLRWEVVTGHRQALDGHPDPRKLTVEGGWSALAKAIGARGSRARSELPGIIAVQGCAVWTWPNGRRGTLLTWDERPPAPGRAALINLVLGDVLLPGAVVEMEGRSRTMAEARRLVPMVDLLPPMTGKRANEQGQQAALQLAVMAEFRRHARELAKQGSIKISLTRWAELARHVGLPKTMLGKVLDVWTQGGNDAPAFLTRPDTRAPWRFGLAQAYSTALAFLCAAGRREEGGKKGGKAARAARASDIERGRPRRRKKPKGQ